jgi:hypothetical protein
MEVKMTSIFSNRKKSLDKWISDPFNIISLHDSKIERLFDQMRSEEPSDGIISSDLRFLAEFKIASGIAKLWDSNIVGLSGIKTGAYYLYFSDRLHISTCIKKNEPMNPERLAVTLAFAIYIDDWEISDELASVMYWIYEYSDEYRFTAFEKFILNTYSIGKSQQVRYSNLEPPYDVGFSSDVLEITDKIRSSLRERDKYLKNEDHSAFDFPGIDVFPIEFGAFISLAKKMAVGDIHNNLKLIPNSFWEWTYEETECISDDGLFERIKTYSIGKEDISRLPLF